MQYIDILLYLCLLSIYLKDKNMRETITKLSLAIANKMYVNVANNGISKLDNAGKTITEETLPSISGPRFNSVSLVNSHQVAAWIDDNPIEEGQCYCAQKMADGSVCFNIELS